MGRGKLPLRLIPKERARKITFEKRKNGLVKKAYELSTLCDVRVCLIVHDFKNQSPDPPTTWPQNPHEVGALIEAYEVAVAKNPSSKRLLTISDFFTERIKKVKTETEKLRHQTIDLILKTHGNYHDKLPLWENAIAELSGKQLFELHSALNNKIEQVEKHIRARNYNTCFNNNNQFAIQEQQMNMQPSFQYYSSHEGPTATQMYQLPCYSTPQPWIDQPSSSKIPYPIASQTMPFDLNNPYKGSFTMMLTSNGYAGNCSTSTSTNTNDHRYQYSGNDNIQYYSSSSTALPEGPADHYNMRCNMFNTSTTPMLESGMQLSDDQSGMVFPDNPLAMQPYVNQPQLPFLASSASQTLYRPAMEPISGQSLADVVAGSSDHGGQIHASELMDVKYYYHNTNDF